MFGGQSAFGSTGSGFGSTPAFGAAPSTSVFGGTQSTFGAQQNKPAFGGTTFGSGGGGLFGSNPSSSGGLFGGTSTTTSTFGGGGGGAFGQPSTTFGAGGFGQTTQQQSGGGLFGSTTTSQSGGLFSQPAASGFGSSGTSGFGSGGGSFGFGGAQQQAGTAHVKFNAMTGSDTMMKSGVQTSISTRHQCIVCMKEYENKSMEELRCEDYLAGRRGTAGTAQSGGLFGSTQPAAGGGLFGSQPASSSGGMFGQQQKPLFGTSGFGGTTTSTAPAFGTGGFGQQTTQSGGLFGAKPFGQQATTSTTGFGGFGQTQPQQQSGGLFGQQNKPFGSVAPQPAGGLFGASSTAGGFGTAASGTSFGGFGTQQQQQPQQNIGLFGQQNQAKPAFGGFGSQPASSAPAFGGFGTSTTTQSGGLFGAANQQKPAFGGFGATTSQPSTGGFGGFGATSSAGGGLFGSNQAKPSFSFGGTSTAGTGFGGFGTSTAGTTGGLFSNTNKPGGLFGGTSTTGFGTGTTGFGTGSAFGTGTSGFGTAGFGQMGASQPQAGASTGPTIQQQLLMSLASSPFGDNPLFKPVAETGKRSEVLKPGTSPAGPSAQKVLAAGQYKVSPHRNIKVRAKPVDSNKSSMFEGLEDDLPSSGDMFVPRSSVKKLVLRPKKTQEGNSSSLLTTIGDDPTQETSLTVPLDESRLTVKKLDLPRPDNDATSPVDDSFVALNTRKKVSEEKEADESHDKAGLNNSQDSNDTEKEDEGSSHPGGIVLKRSGYYTIPPVQDILPDSDGNCIVEGFTIGREGYGNIHYPGNTNITGLNLDEIVFFRHKEVIVYPDDANKPALGEGLNKAAQITLDKVWPTDKSDASIIKSPDRLRGMNYEEKLIRASSRLGARFIEYRPETGSWVFRVDHFSKYGLDESDEDEPVDNKKAKTMHLEKRRTTLDQPSPSLENRNLIINGESLDNAPAKEVTESDGAPDSDSADVEMNDMSSAIMQQKTLLRSALFSEGMDEGEMIDCPPAKPVILQHRTKSPAYIENRPRLIDDKMNSMVIPTSKGLGGSFLLGDSNTSTSLLRSHYSTQSMSVNANTTVNQSRNQSSTYLNLNRTKSNRMPSYTLTSGYDKFTQLQSSVVQEHPDPVTPQYVEAEVPLERSYLSKRFQQYADAGLFQNKRFRVGFINCWEHVENSGGGFVNLCNVRNNELDPAELQSLESWLKVSLENSDCSTDIHGPHFSPVENLDTLHTHYLEAVRQIQECEDAEEKEKLWEIKHTWDLLVALWGRMSSDGEEMEQEERRPVESHTETIERRDKFSAWLEKGVQVASRRDVLRARERTDYLGKVRGLLTGGQVEDACDAIQAAGDHRSALLLAQLGGGGTSSKLLQQQLDQWTEVKADKFISKDRIQLLSLVAGQPVHQGTTEAINTCSRLDWQRSLAQHLWYLTHPVASISDTLTAFDGAWKGSDGYSARPQPRYIEDEEGNLDEMGNQAPLDIKYHLLKLYADRSHRLESALAPTTHTEDQLDFRNSWLIYRVLSSLGYKMSGSSNHDRLCLDFAGQLEHLGSWDWAIFVLLNIKQSDLRRSSVMSVLGRRVSLDDGGKEDWIINTLGVPVTWVARARAVLARKEERFTQLTEQLLLAEDWNEAHKVIIAEIAPSAILSLSYDLLESFLRQIAHPHVSDQICGWESEGKVYLQFIDVDTAVNRFLQNRDIDNLGYELERLKPLVTNLCRTISNLPVNNTKQRLAQSEIAKKVAHFMRAVYSFESGVGGCAATTARQLAESLSTLPLPEDYALQELRTLTRSYLAEIMDS